MKLEHFAINVPDPVKMADWWCENFGMEVVSSGPAPVNARFIRDFSSSICMELYNNPREAPDYSAKNPLELHIGFECCDPENVSKRLVASGAKLVATEYVRGMILVMMRDPWGVCFQLCKRPKPLLSPTTLVTNSTQRLIMDSYFNRFDPNPSRFIEARFIRSCGFNATTLEPERIPLATTALFDKYDPRIFPEGSKERAWVQGKRKLIDERISAAKAAGLKVFANTDIIVLPRKMKELYKEEICGKDGGIDFMKPKTQEIYRSMIAEIFETYPNLDGIVVRTGETYTFGTPYHGGNGPCSYWKDIEGSKKIHAAIMKLLREEICVKHNKTCVYRTWDFGFFHIRPQYYLDVTEQVPPHDKFILSIKHVAGDFFRGIDFNRTLGIGNHKQIVEIQCQREYEGKGAMPSYIASSVINGFEEHENTNLPHSLHEFAKSPLFAGVWTWSRGGGWLGPYIKNEIWCELNARVIAAWAANPSRSEKDCFVEAAIALGIEKESIDNFHKLAILTPQAIYRGKSATKSEMRRGLPIIWTRDQFLGGLDQFGEYLKDVVSRGDVEDLLSDRREAVKIWEEIVELAKTVKCRNKVDEDYILTSSMYGLRLYSMIEAGWDVIATGVKGEQHGGSYDIPRLQSGINRYDAAKKAYLNLPTERPDSATLYTDESVEITIADGVRKINSKPGMGASVDKFRSVAKRQNWPPKIVEGLKQP